MSIRNRTINFDGITVAASQTGLVVAAARIPWGAKIRGVRATAVGAGAGDSISIMRSATMTADDTAANSTVLIHDAALAVVAADTPISDPMTGQYIVAKGVWIYVKATTSTTGYTSLSVQVDLDY